MKNSGPARCLAGEFWADVVIVGAGVVGLITAKRLGAQGLSVALVERATPGAGQSNHSHGYLHRGHIYGNPSPELVRALKEGADRWASELASLDISPLRRTARVGFMNTQSADRAANAWQRAGLTFSLVEDGHSAGLAPLRRVYATREATYDFSGWLNRTANVISTRGHYVFGEVTRLIRDRDSIAGVNVNSPGGNCNIHSNFVVLAAGQGNLKLARSVTNYRGPSINRTSYMLVLRSSTLPRRSLVCPEHQMAGLFIVSRETPAGSYWLASNYISFGEEPGGAAQQFWIRGIARQIMTLVGPTISDDLMWGVYDAPKGRTASAARPSRRASGEKVWTSGTCSLFTKQADPCAPRR